LGKIDERATVLQRQDPRLSHAAAFAKATAEMPRVYAAYAELRERMKLHNMRPTIIK
jgi:hypothetical protein